MADQERRGTKRPSDSERLARLQRRQSESSGKGVADATAEAPSSQPAQPTHSARAAAAISQSQPHRGQPVARASTGQQRHGSSSGARDSRPARPREERSTPREECPGPSAPSPARRGETRAADARPPAPPATLPEMDSVRRALVGNFVGRLTPEVAEVSQCSDPVAATDGVVKRLVEVHSRTLILYGFLRFTSLIDGVLQALCLAFTANAATCGYSGVLEEKVREAESRATTARASRKKAETRANDAKRKVQDLEAKLGEVEAAREQLDVKRREEEVARQRAEEALATAEREHSRFLQEELPRQLEQARRLAVEEYTASADFKALLSAEYRNGFLDMKAGFRITNPHIVGVDWSFALEVSEETAVGEEATPMIEEGEVTGEAMDFENVILLDEPEQPAEPERPPVDEQPDVANPPPAE